MRVAFVSTGSQAMGTNYRVLGLAKSANRLGLDAHIILPGLAENLKWFPEGHCDGVPIHFTGCSAATEARDKYRILRSLRPDFVHCANVVRRCFPVAVAFRALNRCKLIVDVDEHLSRIDLFSSWHRLYFRACENFTKHYPDKLVVASRFLEGWFRRPDGIPVLYLPNAVDLEAFREQKTGWQGLKEQWNGRKVVTYFGALSSHYDADIIFEVAVKLLDQRKDLVFLFIGSGEMLGTLRERTQQAGLTDSIRFCGFVPDEAVPKYLCASDAFVFPIRDNWWNRARCPGKVYYFTAAMAPIVTNSVGEVREALGDRAWYFKDGDADDLIRVLESCLASERDGRHPDRELAEKHSWAARARTYMQFLEAGS